MMQSADARVGFQLARELAPTMAAAHDNYAALAFSLGDAEVAREGYLEELRLEPQSYEACLGLALALQGSFADRSTPKHADDEVIRLPH